MPLFVLRRRIFIFFSFVMGGRLRSNAQQQAHRQKHDGGEVTVFIILNSKAVAREEYSNSGEFK